MFNKPGLFTMPNFAALAIVLLLIAAAYMVAAKREWLGPLGDPDETVAISIPEPNR